MGFSWSISHHSIGQAQGMRRRVTVSLSQDSRGWTSIWMPPGCPRNGTFSGACPTAVSSVHLCFLPLIHPPPSSLVYLLHTPHLTRTTRFYVIHYCILVTHYCLQNTRSVFVGGLAPHGRAQAPRGGGRTLRPPNDISAKDLPSWAPSLVFLKGFFFCVIRSSWQLCSVQLNTQVLFLRQIC